MNDKEYMMLALEQAKIAYNLGEVPVGAVIVQNGKVIATGYNRREIDKNALSHAEHTAIDNACKALGGWRLPRCTLYVTLEPCLMCSGAILHARIDRVVFGTRDEKSGAFGSVLDVNTLPLNHKCEVTEGICAEECKNILQQFFSDLRQRKKKK
ncbi:MAG: tRNA adenosine(34) deaminase TadA [Clostridia bacterium]|nr:tRNA adenosine(34) deaminase TadA [Clostridia bacterium]